MNPGGNGGILDLQDMRRYLSRTLASFNKNKLTGMLAEIEFRRYLAGLGLRERVSEGGWIARCDARGDFGFAHNAIVFFPETIAPETSYAADRPLPAPRLGLHTICSTFHQIGINGFFCAGRVQTSHDPGSVNWQAIQLGRPDAQEYRSFPGNITGFTARGRTHNFERYRSEVAEIPDDAVPAEFSKESIRVAFQNRFYSEISDVDGLFWGQERTYPVEIKEKTRAHSADIGDYFGLDVGPFVKLAYYAAKRGNLHSLFVVREMDDAVARNQVAWRFITFERMAQFASWVFRGGGQSMTGGRSATVRIPAGEFELMTGENLRRL